MKSSTSELGLRERHFRKKPNFFWSDKEHDNLSGRSIRASQSIELVGSNPLRKCALDSSCWCKDIIYSTAIITTVIHMLAKTQAKHHVSVRTDMWSCSQSFLLKLSQTLDCLFSHFITNLLIAHNMLNCRHICLVFLMLIGLLIFPMISAFSPWFPETT
jgi:hypothetical protein